MKVFTAYEAAEMLKVHHNTLLKMLHSGKINAVKLGRSWKITEEELNRVLTAK